MAKRRLVQELRPSTAGTLTALRHGAWRRQETRVTVTLADIEAARRVIARRRCCARRCCRRRSCPRSPAPRSTSNTRTCRSPIRSRTAARSSSSLRSARPSAQRGVIAMSAGNHAQAVAYHAARLGIPATIVMPVTTPFVKVAATALAWRRGRARRRDRGGSAGALRSRSRPSAGLPWCILTTIRASSPGRAPSRSKCWRRWPISMCW